MPSPRADLHSHTTFSDGTSSPAELVEQAVAAKLAAIAVTDHDCVDGVAPAVAAAGGRVEVIAGGELTVAFRHVELHVLGLFVDPGSPAIQERMHSPLVCPNTRLFLCVSKSCPILTPGVRVSSCLFLKSC